MYFADGAGADASGEAYTPEGKQLFSVVPTLVTTTTAWFQTTDSGMDKIVFTHDDTTATTGHRVREIAKALAECRNATAHINGMTDVVDLDNNIFYSNLDFITSLAITLGTTADF